MIASAGLKADAWEHKERSIPEQMGIPRIMVVVGRFSCVKRKTENVVWAHTRGARPSSRDRDNSTESCALALSPWPRLQDLSAVPLQSANGLFRVQQLTRQTRDDPDTLDEVFVGCMAARAKSGTLCQPCTSEEHACLKSEPACAHACMRSKLSAALQPTSLKLVNQSSAHASHYNKDGSAASDAGETHFK